MATWVTIHERRKKPPIEKPDAEVLAATDTGYRNLLADARELRDALSLATDWIRARRRHQGEEKDDV